MKKESFKILIKVNASLMRVRIIDMLKPLDIELIESGSDKILFNEIRENKEHLCCVILYIDELDGLEVVNKIRDKDDKIPIIVLTTNKKRPFHIKGIQIGVNELILVPFKDNTLFSKVQRYVDEKRNSYIELVAFNFESYLEGEIRKAQKGKFPVTLMFTTLSLDVNAAYKPDEAENNYYANVYFSEIKKLFWKTDIFIRFHTRYFLGVFPFCNNCNSKIIEEKVKKRFEHLLEERMIPTAFKPEVEFVTYPEDSENLVALQNKLYKKASTKSNLDIKWFKSEQENN